MILIVASLCVQILCAIDVIRSGRNQIWLLFIMLFSLLGCFAYLMLEVLPQHWNNRHIRTARAQVVGKVDPERAVRDAQRNLDFAETAANYIALGDAQAIRHRYADAESAYRKALAMGPGGDWGTQVKLAGVLSSGAKARRRYACWMPRRSWAWVANGIGAPCSGRGSWPISAARRKRDCCSRM
jgi:hypothetical protein